MAVLNSTRPSEAAMRGAELTALESITTDQVAELFDALTLLQAAGALNREIEASPGTTDANGITAPHERLDTLLRLAEGKVQGAIRAFNAVN